MSKINIGLIIGLGLLFGVFQTIGIDYFYFDRDLIHQGQYWRMLTAHFVHLNIKHLALNLAGLTLVLIIFDRTCSLAAWLILICSSAMLQSMAFYDYLPQVTAYVGFSGVIHSLYVVGALMLFKSRQDQSLAMILLALVTLKLLTENLGQGISMTEQMIGGHVLVEAHLYGAFIGVIFALIKSAEEKFYS